MHQAGCITPSGLSSGGSARQRASLGPSNAANTTAGVQRPSHCRQCRSAAANRSSREAILYDCHDQLIPYEQAWGWQKERLAQMCGQPVTAAAAVQGVQAANVAPLPSSAAMVAEAAQSLLHAGGPAAAAAAAAASQPDTRDTLFLLQHPPVYTLGAGSTPDHLRFDPSHPPLPVHRTERGGEVTYHGPGQLVMYPLLNLSRHTMDLHWYMRCLEEVAIRALRDVSGLQGERLPGLTGVWVDGAKLAAIGVRARRWVTYHGMALNVDPDLAPFRDIVPCGIGDRPVGSVVTALDGGRGQVRASEGRWQQQEQQGQQERHVRQLQQQQQEQQARHVRQRQQQQQQHQQEQEERHIRQLQQQRQEQEGHIRRRPEQQEGRLPQPQGAVSTSMHVPDAALLLEYRYALLEAFEEVFDLQLVPAGNAVGLGQQELQQELQQQLVH